MDVLMSSLVVSPALRHTSSKVGDACLLKVLAWDGSIVISAMTTQIPGVERQAPSPYGKGRVLAAFFESLA